MTYYNVDKVLEILRTYHTSQKAIKCHSKDYQSVGISIITDMPFGGGITDNVANEGGV